jgi:hypothetical protein
VAAAAAAAADVAGAPALEAAAAAVAALALEAAPALEAAGGAAALEAAAAVRGVGVVVGVVVGAAAVCHGEGARSANRASFRFVVTRRWREPDLTTFDPATTPYLQSCERWRAGHACPGPPVGRSMYRAKF